MSRPETLATVALELSALAGRDRRAILAALEPADRDRLIAAMRRRIPLVANAVQAPGDHSSWLQALIAAAGDQAREGMTPAAKNALLEATGASRKSTVRNPGQSLLHAATGLLSGSRTR